MPNDAAPHSLPPGYFDDVYRANPDPWGFTTSPYESGKYAATLAALPRPRYANAFEAGCSIGVLTARLAPRCNRLLAIDVSEDALAQARARCAAFPHVRLERRLLPGEFPDADGPFDLILVSEVGYYLAIARPVALPRTMRHAAGNGRPPAPGPLDAARPGLPADG